MRVELDIFSGRPNPRWELGEQEAVDLTQAESRLKLSRMRPPEPPGLGYRGFRYTDGLVDRTAFGGFVTKSNGDVLADPAHSIERFHLNKVPDQFRDLRNRVIADLGHLR